MVLTRLAFLLVIPALLAAAPATAPRSATGESVAPVATNDYSSPRATVSSFLRAIQSRNDSAIRASLIIADTDKQVVDALLENMSAMGRLQAAASRRFGDDGAQVFGATTTHKALADRLQNLGNAAIDVAGDSATLTLPAGKVSLRRVDGLWKLEAADVLGLRTLSADGRAASVKLARAMSQIAGTMIGELDSGRYLAASDAYKDFWSRCAAASAALSASHDPPATAPGKP